MNLVSIRILYVAYPLLTVSDRSAGGAEQILWTLEREMAARGLHTWVAASAGSEVSGELLVTGEPCSLPDDFERRNREHQDKVVEFVRAHSRQGRPFDLIHDQSGSFWQRANEIDVPVLATLHLPRSFYTSQLFDKISDNVTFNCVSSSQASSFADLNPTVVANGIVLDGFLSLSRAERGNPIATKSSARDIHHGTFQSVEKQSGNGPMPRPHATRRGLLWLGRICEEKAPHLALEIAACANEPLILAGQVYPFSYHQQYFEREVLPRLAQMPNVAFVRSPSLEQKRQLLMQSKAVLITSLAEETSSLVAMEAGASGTPVIAFRRGALPEIVREGVTGFLVDGVEEAVDALIRIKIIQPEACVAHAQKNFSSDKMADGYERLYERIAMKNAGGEALGCRPLISKPAPNF